MIQQLPVLGTFSKGCAGAVSLNMGVSGGRHCDSGCLHHPANDGTRYAVAVEQRADRSQLAAKLVRHEMSDASIIVGRAIIETTRILFDASIPWFRFSTNGSLPQPADARADRRFLPLLRELCGKLVGHSVPVHLPVESADKASFYREAVGDLVCVRESLQIADLSPETIATHAIPSGPVSFTAGKSVTAGKDKLRRILAAADAAARAWSQRTGRRTIVCPAVRVSFLSKYASRLSKAQKEEWRGKAKCGSCTACANRSVDIVYPAHH
jgi:hypothetical protein